MAAECHSQMLFATFFSTWDFSKPKQWQMKKCTYCGKEYGDETSICAIDGEPLTKFPPEPESEPAKPVEEEKTATVEIFQKREAAEIAAGKLQAYGISCWLKSDDAGGMYPNLALAGGLRLQVRASDVEAAAALLKAQLSPQEISELDVKAAAAPPVKETKVKLAPVQIFFGIAFGILLCLLCQQNEKSGTKTYDYYNRNGRIYEQWIYQNGHAIEMRKDRNSDGKWDEWAYYLNSQLFRLDYDDNFDGKPDVWWKFSNGIPTAAEEDTDFNGTPDLLYIYKNGVLQQMDVKPNGSKFATQRWVYQNGVLVEILRGGDAGGNFKEDVRYDPFFNPISINANSLQLLSPSSK